jgi:hypothetical protein
MSTSIQSDNDRVAVAARGDALRAAGMALPLCWIPDPVQIGKDRVLPS